MARSQVLAPLQRNPLECYLLALCAVSGMAGLLSGAAHEGVPWWVDASWHVLLLAGAAVGLAGEYWRDAVTGLLIVRAALLPVGIGAYLYAIPIWGAGVLGAVVIIGFGVAAHWRAVQISRLVRGAAP